MTGNCVTTDPARMRKVARIFEGKSPRARATAALLCKRCPLAEWCEDWRQRCTELATNKKVGGPSGVWAGTKYGRSGYATKNPVAVCGTNGGYYRHLRVTETAPCDECRAAHAKANADDKRKRKAA